jgi:hypothetical protein
MSAERPLPRTPEETGFGEGRWRYLGSVQANPAIHDNLCHHWLAEDVVPVQEPARDAGEAIRVHPMTLEEIKAGHRVWQAEVPIGVVSIVQGLSTLGPSVLAPDKLKPWNRDRSLPARLTAIPCSQLRYELPSFFRTRLASISA